MNNKFKIVLIIYSLLIIIAVFSALYITWTPLVNGHKIGTDQISGVQGRYFIPIIIPILLLFSNSKIKKYKFLNIIRENSFLPFIGILVISSVTILLRYWA